MKQRKPPMTVDELRVLAVRGLQRRLQALQSELKLPAKIRRADDTSKAEIARLTAEIKHHGGDA